eukprot:2144474-Pyramimonas_sp.AAC.1
MAPHECVVEAFQQHATPKWHAMRALSRVHTVAYRTTESFALCPKDIRELSPIALYSAQVLPLDPRTPDMTCTKGVHSR